MFQIELVYEATDGETVEPRPTCQSGDLDAAKAIARHELDVGLYLARLMKPRGPKLQAVHILRGDRVVWLLTARERTAEKQPS